MKRKLKQCWPTFPAIPTKWTNTVYLKSLKATKITITDEHCLTIPLPHKKTCLHVCFKVYIILLLVLSHMLYISTHLIRQLPQTSPSSLRQARFQMHWDGKILLNCPLQAPLGNQISKSQNYNLSQELFFKKSGRFAISTNQRSIHMLNVYTILESHSYSWLTEIILSLCQNLVMLLQFTIFNVNLKNWYGSKTTF
jgi:hypothetical protein